MKKVCLVAINSKYIHTNLAVRLLRNLDKSDRTVVLEHTINSSLHSIVEDIVIHDPVCVMFSSYIWNIDYILKVSNSVKRILPNTTIVLAGPEASNDAIAILESNKFIDIISYIQGEINYLSLVTAIDSNEYKDIEGIYYRDGDKIVTTPSCSSYDLDNQIFPYYDIDQLTNKILYYESSRGCPFRCSYCMSSTNSTIQYMSLTKVQSDLETFVSHNVRQVKFIDRTFNYPIDRAINILDIIIKLKTQYPSSPTTFHCEISPNLVNEKLLSAVANLPVGIVQFEIGIQSTHLPTLTAINRSLDIETQLENIRSIVETGTVHTYVDLIAGLPHETYSTFAKSFNDVFNTNCDVIHLGFLKVLKGSKMENDAIDHSIVYCNYPPYEILCSPYLSYDELSKLRKIEELVDTYINSGNFNNSTNYAVSLFDTPFAFFDMYCDYLWDRDYFGRPHKFTYYFDSLYQFLNSTTKANIEYVRDLLLHDYSINAKPRVYPRCLGTVVDNVKKEFVRQFYNNPDNITKYLPQYNQLSPSTISRQCNIEIFEYNVTIHTPIKEKIAILYMYDDVKSFIKIN